MALHNSNVGQWFCSYTIQKIGGAWSFEQAIKWNENHSIFFQYLSDFFCNRHLHIVLFAVWQRHCARLILKAYMCLVLNKSGFDIFFFAFYLSDWIGKEALLKIICSLLNSVSIIMTVFFFFFFEYRGGDNNTRLDILVHKLFMFIYWRVLVQIYRFSVDCPWQFFFLSLCHSINVINVKKKNHWLPWHWAELGWCRHREFAHIQSQTLWTTRKKNIEIYALLLIIQHP